jgi:Ca-activated chloride channel family protein
MTFAHPSVVWLACAAAPLFALFFWWSWRKRQRLISLFVPRRLRETLTLGLSPRRAQLRAALVIIGIASLLLALARPRYGEGTIEVTQRGLDILVAIDTSNSMLARDAGAGATRLQRARLAALDLARLARTDRIGLIAFAGSAFLQCPLTIDDAAFQQSLEVVDTDIIPQGGTSLAAAIDTAIRSFDKSGANVRVLILFTDGEDHEEGAVEAARRAADAGLRIFTVGIGAPEGDLIRLVDERGNETFLKDAQGNVVKSSLNASLLREVAEAAGGFYMPLQGAGAMDELFTQALAPLPRQELAVREMEQFNERFQWPLAIAIALLAFEAVMPDRGRPRGPARVARIPHPSMATTTTALLALLIILPLSAMAASPRSAREAFDRGDYQTALDEYERLARQKPDDPRFRFNAAVAAHRAGNYQHAARLLEETLRTTDLSLQESAWYNLGNAKFAQGEQLPDAKARQRLWEEAIQGYEAALALDPNNEDARHNRDYVRARLEELKQQQQQQNQNQQNQDQQQDQQNQQNQQDQQDQQDQQQGDPQNDPSQSNQDDSSEADQNQQKPSGSQDESQEGDSSQQEDSQQQEGQEPQEGSESKGQDQGSDPADQQSPQQGRQNQGDKPGEASESQAAQTGDPGETAPDDRMTAEQALRLLDAARGEEKALPLSKRRARARVLKNW